VWINAEVEEAFEGMYGAQLYTIWLPDFRKIKDYVAPEELRLRRGDDLEEDYERILRDHDELLRNHHDILQYARPLEQQPVMLDVENIGLNRRRFPETLGYRTAREEIGRYEVNNYTNSLGSSRGRGRSRDTRSSSVVRTDNDLARHQRSASLPPLNYTWPKLFAQFAHHALLNRKKDVAKPSVPKTKAPEANNRHSKGSQFRRNEKDANDYEVNVNDYEVNIKAPSKLKPFINQFYNSASVRHVDSKEEIYMSQDSMPRADQVASKIGKIPQGNS